VQSVSERFLKLEDVVFGERVENPVDVLVGEHGERHLGLCFACIVSRFWWNRETR
jgi:hypothetical protein